MARRILLTAQVTPPRPRRAVLIKKPVTFEWKGAFENWSKGFVARNFWRVRALFLDEEDALQECALIFVRCCNAYAGKVDNPRWLMALFKRAVANDWHTFSQKDTRIREVPLPDEEEGYDYNAGMLMAAIAQGSDELKTALSAILAAPTELLSLVFFDDDLVKINKRVKRFFGISNSTRDIIGELRELLTR